jgi:hypothetical protein
MFFRRKSPTLDSLDARVTALELLFDARNHDAANAADTGPKPIGDVLAKALNSYGEARARDEAKRAG